MECEERTAVTLEGQLADGALHASVPPPAAPRQPNQSGDGSKGGTAAADGARTTVPAPTSEPGLVFPLWSPAAGVDC